jgi:hypothetical protein
MLPLRRATNVLQIDGRVDESHAGRSLGSWSTASRHHPSSSCLSLSLSLSLSRSRGLSCVVVDSNFSDTDVDVDVLQARDNGRC